MELATQYQALSMEFDFNSGRASPCGSSPSTPTGFGGDYYFSAPTSPAPHTGMIYRDIESYSYGANYARGLFNSTIDDFDAAEHLYKDDNTTGRVKVVSSKDGKHKTATIKSPLLYPKSPNSTKSQHNKKNFWSSFSPKRKKETQNNEAIVVDNRATRRKQGRQSSRETRQVARSLSPSSSLRKPWHEQAHNSTQVASTTSKPPTSPLSSPSSSKGSRKWRFIDLLLFRSASEGRASDKDPLRKYSYFHWKHDRVSKNSSFSHSNNEGSNNVTPTRRGPISAHEQHYTMNKAISQDMKKKSFLPYKQGILGHSAINPTMHALAHGFGSFATQ